MTPTPLGRPLAALNAARSHAALTLAALGMACLTALMCSPQIALIANQFKPGNAGNLDANIKKASSPLMDSIEVIAISSLPLLVLVGVAVWAVGSRKGAESIVKPILFVVAVFSLPGIVA